MTTPDREILRLLTRHARIGAVLMRRIKTLDQHVHEMADTVAIIEDDVAQHSACIQRIERS